MFAIKQAFSRVTEKPRAAIAGLSARFQNDKEGVAAVEFALIVPIMAVMMMGAIELSEAVTVDRRVTAVAAITGDIVAQFDGEMTQQNLLDRVAIGSWMLDPTPKAGLTVHLAFVRAECLTPGTCTKGAVVANTYGGLRLRWQCGFTTGTTGTMIKSSTSLPTNHSGSVACGCEATETAQNARQYGSLPAGSNLILFEQSPSVLVTNVEYSYKPKFFDYFLSGKNANTAGGPATYTLKETIYNKPRGALLNFNAGGARVCS